MAETAAARFAQEQNGTKVNKMLCEGVQRPQSAVDATARPIYASLPRLSHSCKFQAQSRPC
eukprot:382214-Amphidinium_carterae.1